MGGTFSDYVLSASALPTGGRRLGRCAPCERRRRQLHRSSRLMREEERGLGELELEQTRLPCGVADRTLAALPYGELVYARVDLIRDAAGKPCLLELELAEPSLFFAHEPRAAVQLAAATLAWCAPAKAAAPGGKSTGR